MWIVEHIVGFLGLKRFRDLAIPMSIPAVEMPQSLCRETTLKIISF